MRGVTQAPAADDRCAWWDMACRGSNEIANAGLSAITKSIASGAQTLLGQIVKEVDESATVPLDDPTYREVYFGFLGLAAPVVGVVLCLALIMACLRRDAATLGRAVAGIAVASVGGAFYIVFAQLLVAVDNSLSHGVVRVTGYDLANAIDRLAVGFRQVAGAPGEMAANMLLILLMMTMLVAGLLLWFVLVLRKVAILVVVAFAPLLIAGYLWGPTRSWVVRATEVLIALVFTKTAIYTVFGIGLALLSRGTGQSLSDFVSATVLMCGACFTPLLMLRLVHFAANTQLAGDAMGTLRGGVQPIASRMPGLSSSTGMNRHEMARTQGQAPAPDSPDSTKAVTLPTGTEQAAAPPTSSSPGASAVGSGTAVSGSGAATAAGGAATGLAVTGQAVLDKARATTAQAAGTAEEFSPPPRTPDVDYHPDPADPTRGGPDIQSSGDLS
jgi:type IV secretion system protein TrbL